MPETPPDTPPDTLYDEPAYYRMLFRERTRDVAFYREVCEGADRVLELGAGDGRVSFGLAAAGHDVVAVERSRSMLASLEQRRSEQTPEVAARVRAVEADARELDLEERFDRVILPFNGLAHFHAEADVDALFATVREHLAAGGRFVFDVRTADESLREGGASSVPRLVHPRTGRVCRLEERYSWDEASRLLTITTDLVERQTGATQTLTLTMRHWPDAELRHFAERRGFTITQREPLGDAVAYVCEVGG